MNKFIVICTGLLVSAGAYAHEAPQLDPISHGLAHTADSAVLALAVGAVIVSMLAALLRTVGNQPPRR